MNTTSKLAEGMQWQEEELLPCGDDYFFSLLQGIEKAQSTIDLVSYIYEDDTLGKRIEEQLILAATRGVQVRVSVDGVGAQGWIYSVGSRLSAHGIKVKVYHQLPWERLFSTDTEDGQTFWLRLFAVMNRRDHRKLTIIDREVAWVGSLNISDETLYSATGDDSWRELGIRIKGEAIRYLAADFEYSWFPRLSPSRRKRLQALRLLRESHLSPVRVNSTWRLRNKHYRDLLGRIQAARKRVWIANAYFVPSGSFLSALSAAVARGVEVKVITALKSDVFFMPWVGAAFQLGLLEAKVKVYGYERRVFHAKYMLIDDWAMLGSSNLNQRSLLHDREVDVTTENPSTLSELAAEYEKDLAESIVITYQNNSNYPTWKKLIGRAALLFKKYI